MAGKPDPDRITLKEFITAVFLEPGENSPPLSRVELPTFRRPDRPAVSLPDLDLSGETTLSYPEDQIALSDEITPRSKLTLIIGTLASLITSYLGSALLHDGGGFFGWLLLFTGAGIWVSLLYYEFNRGDEKVLSRRPAIEGPGPATPIPKWPPAYDNIRLTLAFCALATNVATYFLTAGNTFTTLGLLTWILSLVIWLIVLSERDPGELFARIRAYLADLSLPDELPENWRWIALSAVMLIVAGVLRFMKLESIPIEMTSDHVEKLIDGYRVSEGARDVFFRGNGGREAIQFYLVALMAKLSGLGWDFTTLKLVSTLEGLALIPLMIPFGRRIVDRETGAFAGALLAFSWWHMMLGRMALRIVLTPLVMTLLLMTLARGIRTGWRKSWLWAGFWMGIGVYSYQALRITPLVAAGAFLVTIIPDVIRALWASKTTSEEAGRAQKLFANVTRRSAMNLLSAAIIALTIFVPMLRVWHDYPGDLWNRVVNRTTSSESEIVEPVASIFADNFGDALKMFHQVGDAAWINAPAGTPALDSIMGAIFILGAAGWIYRVIKNRDPVDSFLLLAFFILLLPTALAIAFPIENPSFTRASGVIPVVFLFMGHALALIRQGWRKFFSPKAGSISAFTLIGLMLITTGFINQQIIMRDYADSYRGAAQNPGEVAAAVAAYLPLDRDISGIHLVGWPYWQDYRAIGIELGDITFNNAILDSDVLESLLADPPGLFEVRPLIFIVHPLDLHADAVLEEYFPEGHRHTFTGSAPGHEFNLYIVD